MPEKPRRTTTQSHKESETEIYEVRQSYLRPRGRKEMRNTRNFEEYNILSLTSSGRSPIIGYKSSIYREVRERESQNRDQNQLPVDQ